jgi:hypothetical protein
MEWNYRCPLCNKWCKINWSNRFDSIYCAETNTYYMPPSPVEQHDAYVDTHDWPDEMELAVISLKGYNCIVHGCIMVYETLDHRIPFSKEGKTSVSNLFPMCNEHNDSKGDSDYFAWLNDMIFKSN